jgi:hypothetical protein
LKIRRLGASTLGAFFLVRKQIRKHPGSNL